MTACTDDERRKVARRLRSFVTDDSVYADVDACHVLHSIGLYYKDIDRIYFSGFDVAHLADLIDPTCLARADVEDTPDGGQFECWSCSVCGNIVSVDPDYDTETDGPAYCEACGHRIVGKGEPTWL